jgi:hypothetical protein
MAIDAFEGRVMLPEHDLLIIDEGHELVSRGTSTITDGSSARPVSMRSCCLGSTTRVWRRFLVPMGVLRAVSSSGRCGWCGSRCAGRRCWLCGLGWSR